MTLCGHSETWGFLQRRVEIVGAYRSTKRLRSVIHSVAHHAMSGLCYVHPHLGEQCKAASVREAEVDLCAGVIRSDGLTVTEPLRRGTVALREKFVGILASEDLLPDIIESATIRFQFGGSRWPISCYAALEDENGISLDVAVSSSGRKAETLRASGESEQ